MKLLSNISSRRQSAFTLAEMTIATGIYCVLFIGSLVFIQVFAMRIYTLAATKLTSTETSRQALNHIREDIRQSKYVQVGSTDNTGHFNAFAGTNLAQGNAIKIWSTTNGYFTNAPYPYSIYYLQTNNPSGVSSNNLMWISVTTISTNSFTNVWNVASYITNLDIFATTDCLGNVTSNAVANNWVYTVKLQFYQWEYPIAVISSNRAANAYDYYQLRTRICRRALD